MTNNRMERDNFNASKDEKNLIRISGKIRNYSQCREEGVFIFTKNEKSAMEVIAVLASLAGLGGQATAVSSGAHSLEESADYVEFYIEEKKVKGWLWRSPFSNCDDVHVATEWNGEYYELFGICRPEDRMIALYPHCSRGRMTHIRNAIKWWCILTIGFNLGMILIAYFDQYSLAAAVHELVELYGGEGGWMWLLGTTGIVTVPAFSFAIKWMPFVRVAEKVFNALGLPNAGNIDLVKSSKSQRTQKDKSEFGSMYFRY